MQKLLRFSILLAIFSLTILSLLAANEIEKQFPTWRPVVAVCTGSFFGVLLYLLISKIMKIYNFEWNRDYDLYKTLLSAMILGIIAFGFSLLIFYFVKGLPPLIPLTLKEILIQSLFQLRPAIIEEVGFRFGLVCLTLFFVGRNTAIVAGTIPFGLLHLLNFIGGQPIFWDYIFDTAIAGLFLSMVFLNFGLGGAVVTHYAWNVLASLCTKLFSIQQEDIEGGVGTLITLVILSVLLFYRHKKRIRELADC